MDFKKILFKTNSFDVEKSLPDALIMCTQDGKIQWVNDIAVEIFETSKIHLLTSEMEDFIENVIMQIHTSITIKKPVITKLKNKESFILE